MQTICGVSHDTQYLFSVIGMFSVHLKLGLSVADFLKVKNVKIMEVSVARTT